jgi:hypothetical protein
MGIHPLEFASTSIAYQNGYQDDDDPFGTSTRMGYLFDEFAGFLNFNFLSDPSHYA